MALKLWTRKVISNYIDNKLSLRNCSDLNQGVCPGVPALFSLLYFLFYFCFLLPFVNFNLAPLLLLPELLSHCVLHHYHLTSVFSCASLGSQDWIILCNFFSIIFFLKILFLGPLYMMILSDIRQYFPSKCIVLFPALFVCFSNSFNGNFPS